VQASARGRANGGDASSRLPCLSTWFQGLASQSRTYFLRFAWRSGTAPCIYRSSAGATMAKAPFSPLGAELVEALQEVAAHVRRESAFPGSGSASSGARSATLDLAPKHSQPAPQHSDLAPHLGNLDPSRAELAPSRVEHLRGSPNKFTRLGSGSATRGSGSATHRSSSRAHGARSRTRGSGSRPPDLVPEDAEPDPNVAERSSCYTPAARGRTELARRMLGFHRGSRALPHAARS
jgi:hypothetical protein